MSSQSYLTLCDPRDCSQPGSTVYGIFQARILKWVAISSSRGSSQPKVWARISCVFCIAGGFFTRWAAREAICLEGGTKILSASCGRLLYVSESCCVNGRCCTYLVTVRYRPTESRSQPSHSPYLYRWLPESVLSKHSFVNLSSVIPVTCGRKHFQSDEGLRGYKVVQIKGLRVQNTWTYFRM